jgi:M6 family metalloprotease-like protein
MAEPQVWADGVAGTVIGADVWNVRTVLVTDWSGGRLLALTVEHGELTEWGDGYVEPESVSVLADEALITERGGTLLLQDLNTPGRANAQVVASGLGSAHQVVRTDDGAALVADRAGGRVVRVDLATGDVSDVVTGLAQPVGVALGADGAIFVTEQGTGALTRHDAGATVTIVGGLVAPFFLSWADDARTHLLVPERAPTNRVGIVDVTAAAPVVERLVGRRITQPSQALTVGDLLVVTGAGRLLALDASSGLAPGVKVATPPGPLWPGSWADVQVDTGVTGWTRPELSITTQPPGVLTVDEHPGADADPTRPTVRLLAHSTLGPVDVVVVESATMTEVGRGHLSVGFDPDSPLDGPPIWIDTPSQPPALHTLAAVKGVNDAGKRSPKDYAGKPTSAWRVVAALVDTKDARWSATVTPTSPAPTIATAQTTWRNVLVGANGVDAFYREMSGNRLTMQLVTGAVQGPVQLDGTWTDWFTMPAGTAQWLVKDDVVQRVVTALQSVTDWTKVDALFLVFRSPNATNYIWPRAADRVYRVAAKDGAGKDVTLKICKVGMPHDQATIPGLSFTNVEVSAHELGHTLGLDDLYMDATYTDAMQARDLKRHELMSDQTALPHLSARHKLLLGFLDTGHVRSFDYGFADEATFDLAAVSDGLPTGGAFAAVELKVAPRLSWFFEYRVPRPGRIGDGGADFAGGKVMGYDATQYELPPIVADKRRPIILVLDDGDGEGALLNALGDWEHLDVEGQALSQFRLEVLSMTPTSAKVKVKVGAVTAPDPYIVGNNGPKGDYKSPDVEVRNELSDKDAAWLNRPIIGVNRVVAKIHNGGGLDAPNVTVRFKVLPFNTDDPDSERWLDLGDPVTHDVKAGQIVEFETQWSPDHNAHFCIQARINRYTSVPGAAADEPDVDNNLAQSNYFKIESKPSSPATREVSFVEVHNPYPYAASALVDVAQDSDAYRTFVQHQWIHLEPGQTRRVRMEVESKATSIWDAIERHHPDGNSWLRTWFPATGCVARTGSGVTVAAATAVATTVRVVERAPELLIVQVTSPAGGPPPHDGTVLMQIDGDGGRHDVIAAPVEANGIARLQFAPINGRGVLHYSGTQGYAAAAGIEIGLER